MGGDSTACFYRLGKAYLQNILGFTGVFRKRIDKQNLCGTHERQRPILKSGGKRGLKDVNVRYITTEL